MLDKLRATDFTPHIGETFAVRPPGGAALAFVLTEVSERSLRYAAYGHEDRIPFSVVFRGPVEPILPQSMYSIEHGTFGRMELFVVPLGPDAEGMLYQAVFS